MDDKDGLKERKIGKSMQAVRLDDEEDEERNKKKKKEEKCGGKGRKEEYQ